MKEVGEEGDDDGRVEGSGVGTDPGAAVGGYVKEVGDEGEDDGCVVG